MSSSRDIDWNEVEPEERKLSLSTLRFSPKTQPREDIDESWVEKLADKMRVNAQNIVVDNKGERFDPIIAFYDGSDYWVADGHHRGRAARQIGADTFQVLLYQGSKRDAITYSVGANAKHGKPRSDADINKAILRLLLDDEWRYWSDREIARQCNVNNNRVSRRRRKLMRRDPDYAEDVGDERLYEVDGETRTWSRNSGNGDGGGDENDDSGNGATWSLDEDPESSNENENLDTESPQGSGRGSSGSNYKEQTNFEPIPGALGCASYAQYDPIGKTTIACGCSIRDALEEIAPIDLMISTGPNEDQEYTSWVEASAHTLSDEGVLIALFNPSSYPIQCHALTRRFTHHRTQLLRFGTGWRMASIWHQDLEVDEQFDVSSWGNWSSSIYRPYMDVIALPYAETADLASGLLGPDRAVTLLTQSEEDVDAIASNL